MPHDQINPAQLKVFPLAQRTSLIHIRDAAISPQSAPPDPGPLRPKIGQLAQTIRAARARGAAVILAYGAHLIKNGAGPLVNALLQDRWVTHLATHGAGIIHDWEFAFHGQSSESVRDNAPLGRFGAWDETGRCLNLAVIAGAAEGLGLGEAVGRLIAEDGLTLPPTEQLHTQIRARPEHPLTAARADLLAVMRQFHLPAGPHRIPHPYKQHSLTAAACQRQIPLTVHPGIGYDIITNHPMFHGAAIGRTAATDARIFAHSILDLTGGVYLSVGSAIMSPQIFEKAFSAANNILAQRRQPYLHDHTIAIVDLQNDGGWDWTTGEPPADHPAYYLRFCKSFHRMGGNILYLKADNRLVLHNLLAALHSPPPNTP